MGWFGKKQEDDDTALVEISNDNGDHYVAEIPSNDADEVRGWFRKSGMRNDQDYEDYRHDAAQQQYSRRDHDAHRYRIERVVDESEDLEDSYDQENDTSDYERSEQPAESWWSWW